MQNNCETHLDILLFIDELITAEKKLEDLYKNYGYGIIKHITGIDNFDEIYILSSYVKKNIYNIQVYLLQNVKNSKNSNISTKVLKILKLIQSLQKYYVDFLYNRFCCKRLENFDMKKCEIYQSMINDEIKILNLKMN